MRTVMVVVMLPSLQFFPRIMHRNELVDVQKLITQATVERLDEPVVRGLSRPRVVELHASERARSPTAAGHRCCSPMVAMAFTLPSGGWMLLQVLVTATVAQVVSKQCAAACSAPRPFAIGLSENHLQHGPRAGLPSTHAAVMGSVVGFMVVAAPGHPWLAVLGALALATAWARVIECLGCEFRDVVHGDRLEPSMLRRSLVQGLTNAPAGEPEVVTCPL